MGRPADCSCHCCDNDVVEQCSAPLNFFDQAGDPSIYSIVGKEVGSVAITQLDVTPDAANGLNAPAHRIHLRWSQSQPQVFPETRTYWVRVPTTEYDGAIVTFIRNDGPHFAASAERSFLSSLGIDLNVRGLTIIERPDNTLGVTFPPDIPKGFTTTGSVNCYSENFATGQRHYHQPAAKAKIRVFAFPAIQQDGRVYACNGLFLDKQRCGFFDPSAFDVYTFGTASSLPHEDFAESRCWLRLTQTVSGYLAPWPRYREWARNPKVFWASGGFNLQDNFVDWDTTELVRDGLMSFGYKTPLNWAGDPTQVILDTDGDPAFPPTQITYGLTPDLEEDGGDVSIGWCIGFVGSEAGDYEIEALVDNVCLTYDKQPWQDEDCGAIKVDEPLNAGVPAGWTSQSQTWQWGSIPTTPVLANWHSDNGQLVVDSSAQIFSTQPYQWREHRYARHSKYIELPMPDRTDPNFCVTLEARLHRINERDVEWEMSDRAFRHTPNDSIDLNRLRPLEDFGIFVGRCARAGILLNRNDPSFPAGALYNGIYPSQGYCGFPFDPTHCVPGYVFPPFGSVEWPRNCLRLWTGDLHFWGDEGDDTHDNSTSGETHYCTVDVNGPKFTNGPTKYTIQLRSNMPGIYTPGRETLLRLQISRAYPTPQGPCGGNVVQYNYPMTARVWVNHRLIDFGAQPFWFLPEEPQHFNWLTNPEPLRVGVFAKYGGRWSDFKCWTS